MMILSRPNNTCTPYPSNVKHIAESSVVTKYNELVINYIVLATIGMSGIQVGVNNNDMSHSNAVHDGLVHVMDAIHNSIDQNDNMQQEGNEASPNMEVSSHGPHTTNINVPPDNNRNHNMNIDVRPIPHNASETDLLIILDQSTGNGETGMRRFLRVDFSHNILFQCPNIFVLLSMLQLTVFSLLFSINLWASNRNFKYMLLGYLSDLLIESFTIYLYKTKGDLFPRMRIWDFIPFSLKWIGLCIFFSDLMFNHNTSVYFCFLPVIPGFFQVARGLAYSHLKPVPPVLSILIGVCEMLFILRYFGKMNIIYPIIFILPFYYFLLVQFLNLITLMTSIVGFLLAACSCFTNFSFKLFFVQFFLGVDAIVGCVIFLTLARWTMFRGKLEEATSSTDSNSKKLWEEYRRDDERYTRIMQVIATVLFVYSVVRNMALYHLTKKRLTQSEEHLLRSQGGYSMGVSDSNRERYRGNGNQPEMRPQVSKPKTSDSILSFIRINPNYYISNENNQNVPRNSSNGNQIGVQNHTENIAILRKEDEQCSLCVVELQDCIILPCKHGGICKKCSIDWMKKSNKCPFCRKLIERTCVVKMISRNNYKILEEIILR